MTDKSKEQPTAIDQKAESVERPRKRAEKKVATDATKAAKPEWSRISDAGVALIKEFEGYGEDAYLCPSGVWTIGWGHTKGVKEGDKTNPVEAQGYLYKDLETAEKGVQRLVKTQLSAGQYDALVSFAFNVGVSAFESSTLLRILNSGRHARAALQFAVWNKGRDKDNNLIALDGLTRRREAEKALFLS